VIKNHNKICVKKDEWSNIAQKINDNNNLKTEGVLSDLPSQDVAAIYAALVKNRVNASCWPLPNWKSYYLATRSVVCWCKCRLALSDT
jgi:hypothetical protein